MAKLPDKFEDYRLELLTPIVSDGTLKSRRNLVVSSFIIVAIYLLDKSLLDLNVFGLKLAGANQIKVLVFALCMICFWAVLFLINGSKDAALNRERRYLLSKDTDIQLASIEQNLSNMVNLSQDSPNFPRKSELERERKKHIDQIERNRSAKTLAVISFSIDSFLPLILASLAVYYLISDILLLKLVG